MEFSGKTAFVTGAANGIGLGICRALARSGVNLVLADIERFCVQGEDTQRRLVDLGADPARITMTGSLKFDALDASATRRMSSDAVLRCFRMTALRQAAPITA